MTVYLCDGFEAYGNTSSAGADVETIFNATNRQAYTNVSGGHGGDVALIDDFETLGYAIQLPQLDAGRGEWLTYEFPDGTGRNPDYKLSANASSPIMCTGFRFYNATTTPALAVTIFQLLSSSTGSTCSVSRLSDETSLRFTDASSVTHDATDCLTPDTWHYVEFEWKYTTGANGGYLKIYVDGTEVLDSGAVSTVSATFFSSWGWRVGCAVSSNQTSGNQFAFDDVYGIEIDGVTHTAPLGSCRVFAMRPASDSSVTFSPSTGGDNFALIDEDSQDQSDYVESGVSGDIDKYGLTPVTNVTSVHGVRVDCSCVAIGSATTFAIGLDDGTLDEDNMGSIATVTPGNIQEFHALDPSGSAWTESSVEAVKATQKEV